MRPGRCAAVFSSFDFVKLNAMLRDFYNLTHIRITVFDDACREITSYPADIAPVCRYIRSNPGADAAYTLYNDAGDGYAYEQGAYTLTRLRWDDAARRLTAVPEGSAEYHCRTIRSEIVE